MHVKIKGRKKEKEKPAGVWWYLSVKPALWEAEAEDHKFKLPFNLLPGPIRENPPQNEKKPRR